MNNERKMELAKISIEAEGLENEIRGSIGLINRGYNDETALNFLLEMEKLVLEIGQNFMKSDLAIVDKKDKKIKDLEDKVERIIDENNKENAKRDEKIEVLEDKVKRITRALEGINLRTSEESFIEATNMTIINEAVENFEL